MTLVHENGWHQVAVEDGSGSVGDNAVSEVWTAYYEKVNSDWRGEISYYTIFTPRPGLDGGEPEDAWGIEYRIEVYRRVDGDQADLQINYDYGSPFINYDYGSPFYYSTIERADEAAKALAERDESYVFIV